MRAEGAESAAELAPAGLRRPLDSEAAARKPARATSDNERAPPAALVVVVAGRRNSPAGRQKMRRTRAPVQEVSSSETQDEEEADSEPFNRTHQSDNKHQRDRDQDEQLNRRQQQQQFMLVARMLADQQQPQLQLQPQPQLQRVASGAHQMEALAMSRIQATVNQFMQVPSFSQPPQSFNQVSRTLSTSAANEDTTAARLYQSLSVDLGASQMNLSAPVPQAAASSAGLFEQAAAAAAVAQNSLSGLMAAAAAAARHRQQNLLGQFSSLHSLSAVATAIHQSQSGSAGAPTRPTQPTTASSGPNQLAALTQPVGLHQAQVKTTTTTTTTPTSRTLHANGHKPGGRKRRGARKCRKVYGMAQRPLWCTQCKWKKACSRFTPGQLAAQQPEVSTTTATNPAGRRTSGVGGQKWRAQAANSQGAASLARTRRAPEAAEPNGNHLIRNLLDMGVSFQRLQAAAAVAAGAGASAQPTFRNHNQQL